MELGTIELKIGHRHSLFICGRLSLFLAIYMQHIGKKSPGCIAQVDARWKGIKDDSMYHGKGTPLVHPSIHPDVRAHLPTYLPTYIPIYLHTYVLHIVLQLQPDTFLANHRFSQEFSNWAAEPLGMFGSFAALVIRVGK